MGFGTESVAWGVQRQWPTCRGRCTCSLWVRCDGVFEAEGAASLRHLEREEALKQIHSSFHTSYDLIWTTHTFQQPDTRTHAHS